ncbi:MAG: efflux RND transporter permease subunit, partial [Desulfosarcina sp.]
MNDFNRFGRVFRVMVQGEPSARNTPEDVYRINVRNSSGEMVPLRTLVDVQPILGPERIERYNLFPSAIINGDAAAGYSSGQAITAMEQVADLNLPGGYTYEWTGMSLEEIKAGAASSVVLILSLIFAYLFLVAQYESWTVPWAVMLSVGVAAFGALLGL